MRRSPKETTSAVEPAVDAADSAPAEASKVPTPGVSDLVIQTGAVVIAVTAIALLIRHLAGGQPAPFFTLVQILLALATVAGVCWGAWQRHRLWTSPIRQLGKIVDDVR